MPIAGTEHVGGVKYRDFEALGLATPDLAFGHELTLSIAGVGALLGPTLGQGDDGAIVAAIEDGDGAEVDDSANARFEGHVDQVGRPFTVDEEHLVAVGRLERDKGGSVDYGIYACTGIQERIGIVEVAGYDLAVGQVLQTAYFRGCADEGTEGAIGFG